MSITKEEARQLIVEAIGIYARANPTPDYWTVDQLAEKMGCHPQTVRKMKLRRDRRKRIPHDVAMEALGLRAASR